MTFWRHNRSLVQQQSGDGGGGGGLPERTTAPTFIGGVGQYNSVGAGTVSVPGTDLTGDLVISSLMVTNISVLATMNSDTAGSAVELDPLTSGDAVGSVFNMSQVKYRFTAGDTETTTFSGGGANPACTVHYHAVWRNADDPILVDSGVFGEGFGSVNGTQLIFPDFVVPTGYLFLLLVAQGDGYTIGSVTWTGVTASTAFNTTNGFDQGMVSAQPGAGSYVGAKVAINLSGPLPIGYIVAIPGTT